jgi:N-acyl-D-aspartate/D-glutamate deacylase
MGQSTASGAAAHYQTIIRNGLFFDGSGQLPQREDIAIDNGVVAARGDLSAATAEQSVDAQGHWVMPGLLDIHTHLDLEVELDPTLPEVVRHGTTTVVVGNCSLGAAFGNQRQGDQDPIIDCFARVENLPKSLLSRCGDAMHWNTTAGYMEHFAQLPLGPNIAPLIPHSMLRIEAMGLEAAISRAPTKAEMARMIELLRQAMEQGYAGFSTDSLPFHYLANQPNTDKKIPTHNASSRELTTLLDVVRDYDRVWQATPDSQDKVHTFRLFSRTSGWFKRRALRTSALTAIDTTSNRQAWRLTLLLAKMFNSWLFRGKFHFQVLSTPFKVWGDGATTPGFEELPAAMQLIAKEVDDRQGRAELMAQPAFKAQFVADWDEHNPAITFKRDLATMVVDRAPVAGWRGRNFAELKERLQRWQQQGDAVCLEPAEQQFFASCPAGQLSQGEFLFELIRQFDRDLCWYAVSANDRPEILEKLLFNQHTLPGFNDCGAHITNMAFYDGNLITLQIAQRHSLQRVAEAVKRLTRDPAAFFNLNTGSLEIGDQADVTIINPEQLAVHDAEAARQWIHRDLFSHDQLVNRPNGVVEAVFIAGQLAWHQDAPAPALGEQTLGRALRAA